MTTETLIPVTLRPMGRPPRLQPTVCSLDLVRFIFREPSVETDPEKGMAFLSLKAACKMLEELIRRPEGQEYNIPACQRLLCWLCGYEQIQQSVVLN